MKKRMILGAIQTVLESIHDEKSEEVVRKQCKELKEILDAFDEKIDEDEIDMERLEEYIKLIQRTGVSEDRLFSNKNDFYDLLNEEQPELWEEIYAFLQDHPNENLLTFRPL